VATASRTEPASNSMPSVAAAMAITKPAMVSASLLVASRISNASWSGIGACHLGCWE